MRSYLSSFLYAQPQPSTSQQQLVVQLTQDAAAAPSSHKSSADKRHGTIDSILALDDLYEVLGLQKSSKLDAQTLRRAYLLRSRACHPECVVVVHNTLPANRRLSSKFPDYHEPATLAFKKVSAAYEVLSKPSSRRAYDSRTPGAPPPNLFATRPADATFNGVLYSVFCDFVEGDLETLRTFLRMSASCLAW